MLSLTSIATIIDDIPALFDRLEAAVTRIETLVATIDPAFALKPSENTGAVPLASRSAADQLSAPLPETAAVRDVPLAGVEATVARVASGVADELGRVL